MRFRISVPALACLLVPSHMLFGSVAVAQQATELPPVVVTTTPSGKKYVEGSCSREATEAAV